MPVWPGCTRVMCGQVCAVWRPWWGLRGTGLASGRKCQEDAPKSSHTLRLMPGLAVFTSLLLFKGSSFVQICHPSLGGGTQCGLLAPARVSRFHWMSVISPCPRAGQESRTGEIGEGRGVDRGRDMEKGQ